MVDPFAQQHLPGSVRAVEEKLRARRAHDSILYGLELQVENLPQIVLLQAPEDDYVVDPVHELRRKLTSGGFNPRPGNLLIKFRGRRICRDLDWSKTDTARNQFRHLAGSQVRRHNHYRAREINAAVIAQGQGCLIQNAEQQLPQTIRSLFDLIEENEAEPRVFGVHAIEILLRQHRAGFTMSQITRRRTDQLGYLVRVLKLGAVNLDNCIRVAEENLGSGFNDARFAGSCRPQEEHRTDRLVWEDSCPPGRLDKGRSSVVRRAPDRQCVLTASLQTHWRRYPFDRLQGKPCLSSRQHFLFRVAQS